MDELLKQILVELKGIKEGQDVIRSELIGFRDSQDVTNKLLLGEIRGAKTELRDFKAEVKGWQRYTDARLDSLEGTIERMRDSLQQ